MELNDLKALFLDLSGVLYEGDRLLDGAVDAVREARERGLALRFVTNTATKSRRRILEKLHGMDIPLEDDELFTAPMAARDYVRARGLRAHWLVHENLREDLPDPDPAEPDAVVVGDARDDLTYEALNRAFRIVREGGTLIGIGYNKFFKDDDGLKLDAGAFLHALEWAADAEAVITGKPSREFYDAVVASVGVDPGDCLMIGDDADADVTAAVDAGLHACLVRTGKYQAGDEERLPDAARVIDSISNLFD